MGPTGLNPEELMNVVYMKNLEEKVEKLEKENEQLKKERDRYKGEVEELSKMLDD